jgi:hypothetical protein
MNKELTILQQEFVQRYGDPYTFDELFDMTVEFVKDQIGDIELLGFYWDISESAIDSDMMVGKTCFRFDGGPLQNVNVKDLLNNSLFQFGAGGYSTWGGPWNELGKTIEKMNGGIPWKQKMPLQAYTFSIEICRSNFTKILHSDVMNKIASAGPEIAHCGLWEKEGQKDEDTRRLTELVSLREKSGLRKVEWKTNY